MGSRRDPRLVVLDRDGTINIDSDDYIRNAEQWHPIPGAIDAIARLCQNGWTVTVATNQSGLARGLFTISDLFLTHEKMTSAIAAAGGEISGVFYCPHAPDDDCQCRKPRPGLLHEIAERFNVSLDNVPVIGDSQRDLDAAAAAGARPILVLTGKTRPGSEPQGVECYPDLVAAVDSLLEECST